MLLAREGERNQRIFYYKFLPYFFLKLFLSGSVILQHLKTKIILEVTNFRLMLTLFREILFLGPLTKTQAGVNFYNHYDFTCTGMLTSSHSRNTKENNLIMSTFHISLEYKCTIISNMFFSIFLLYSWIKCLKYAGRGLHVVYLT